MKLLDSDIIGILLALATFVVPVISGILEKKRKEKKKIEAKLLGEELPEESPKVEEPVLNEELEELFSVLMGKQVEEPDPHEDMEPQPQPEPVVEENVVSQTHTIAPPSQIEVSQIDIPDGIMGPEEASGENKGEAGIKERLKRNPKEAVVLSEILTPKFKQYN